MKNLLTAVAIACSALALPAAAANVNINLAGAATGTIVTGVGASFAQRFAGQTVSGIGITGSPTNPLTLQAAGTIAVAFFNPGVSAASDSLLSQPGNAAPLSILLGSDADSFNWTMGSGDDPAGPLCEMGATQAGAGCLHGDDGVGGRYRTERNPVAMANCRIRPSRCGCEALGFLFGPGPSTARERLDGAKNREPGRLARRRPDQSPA